MLCDWLLWVIVGNNIFNVLFIVVVLVVGLVLSWVGLGLV